MISLHRLEFSAAHMSEGLQRSIKIINLDKTFVIHIIHLYGKLAIILNSLTNSLNHICMNLCKEYYKTFSIFIKVHFDKVY